MTQRIGKKKLQQLRKESRWKRWGKGMEINLHGIGIGGVLRFYGM